MSLSFESAIRSIHHHIHHSFTTFQSGIFTRYWYDMCHSGTPATRILSIPKSKISLDSTNKMTFALLDEKSNLAMRQMPQNRLLWYCSLLRLSDHHPRYQYSPPYTQD